MSDPKSLVKKIFEEKQTVWTDVHTASATFNGGNSSYFGLNHARYNKKAPSVLSTDLKDLHSTPEFQYPFNNCPNCSDCSKLYFSKNENYCLNSQGFGWNKVDMILYCSACQMEYSSSGEWNW